MMGAAMPKRSDIGVKVFLACPECHHREEVVVAAGSGLKPGDVLEQSHLPGFCLTAEEIARWEEWR